MLHFAEWAATAGEEDGNDPWLELPEGVFFLGLSQYGSCMYVREAYRKLADTMDQWRLRDSGADRGTRHVVVSGNPGIGKSWFARWMLVR